MRLIRDKVREFSAVTGLTISIPKSKFYFGEVDEESNEIIQQTIGNFLWSGKECFTRKAPIPWDHISDPVSADGLNLIYLKDWNKTTIGKLLWNVFVKKDRLWINWVHLYYLEKKDVATYIPKTANKYETKKIYHLFRGPIPKVSWRNLFYGNIARPRVTFTLLMACQDRLPTKDRLLKFGTIIDGKYAYYGFQERCRLLFFECEVAKRIWSQVLNWLNISHRSRGWDTELNVISKMTSGKECRKKLLKLAFTETVYAIWTTRNMIIFYNKKEDCLKSKDIIEKVLCRADKSNKLAMFCNRL
ncbi:hypothetical protein KIW84_065516 [Lathyrus oleraceus]|uniref:Reverse transcriptase zinc-binding domain-containing protein n=1 Tax=Pisum sativum TaxID=3888 RepID=A0A9D5AAH5_PEA|nr:hypothetical protein KIW84_065516 [Pisum sativum]